MRPALRRLAIIALPALILMIPAGAAAFPLTNCTLMLTSRDAGGTTIDTATAGGADSTQANPFLVDWDGTVAWTGTMGTQVIKDHSWGVSVFNIPTPLAGGDPNEGGDTDGDGTVQVGENLPIEIVGLFFVSGSISGDGGSCAGSGWMRLRGDAFGTIPFWVALGLIVLGVVGLWAGYRRGWGWAVIGGLLLGLGAAAMLIMYAVMLVGSWTPLAALAVALVLGIVVAILKPETV